MLYSSLKIVHILSATLLLMGIAASMRFWFTNRDPVYLSEKIQAKTIQVIVPFALLQLVTGFTMISLKHYALSETWIQGSLMSFVVLIASWFAFLFISSRQWQKIFLSVCLVAIGCMIFLMANTV